MNFAGRFLIKTSSPAPVGFGAASGAEFPLFAFGMAAAGGSDWVVAPLKTATAREQNGWDLAHELLAAKSDVAGVPITLIEPDFISSCPFTRTEPGMLGAAAAGAAAPCSQDPADASWPNGVGFAWHLDPQHSQLLAARNTVGVSGANRIRIAHLDTGYSPAHQALPQFLRSDLARNFVEVDNPGSAVDPGTSGLGKNPGHGTGTIGILAGGTYQQGGWNDFLGGAPYAEVVPVRIGTSVVHFYSSSMAQGLDYALAAGARVVTISMGGVPSKAWAEAVNRLYEAGIAVFAAAGNNIGGFPTTSTVYPARFNRVTSVCGAAADHTPYFKGILHKGMQGNFGPSAKMMTALAAYTPNITWAEWGCPQTVDLDGAGTSSATPQAAAAAALWFQKYATILDSGSYAAQRWLRVEVVRRALFSSADKTSAHSAKFFGQGLLRANNALAVQPVTNLTKTAEDKVSWPWLRLLFGVGAAGAGPREEMLELEAIQLLTMFDELAGEEAELMHEDAQPSPNEVKRIALRLSNSPRASVTLRQELKRLTS